MIFTYSSRGESTRAAATVKIVRMNKQEPTMIATQEQPIIIVGLDIRDPIQLIRGQRAQISMSNTDEAVPIVTSE